MDTIKKNGFVCVMPLFVHMFSVSMCIYCDVPTCELLACSKCRGRSTMGDVFWT